MGTSYSRSRESGRAGPGETSGLQGPIEFCTDVPIFPYGKGLPGALIGNRWRQMMILHHALRR